MKYNDYAIEQLIRQLCELFNKKSTPKKTAGIALEALEVIRQLQKNSALPPNPPLSLDELREMDGEPVWIRNHRTGTYMCRVLLSMDEHFTFFTDGGAHENRSHGTYWTAYRRKPEEGHE